MNWEERTLEVPAVHACPSCTDAAQFYARYAAARKKDELETSLYRGTASIPDQIKACWNLHGEGREWPQDRGYSVQIPARMLMRGGSVPLQETPYAEDFHAFTFHREVTHSRDAGKDFTVTRIHCRGVTVEETYS